MSGRGRLFLIAGEPGIGKTRLADELATHASRRGLRVLWGRSWEGGGAPANWPWVQILRGLARGATAEALAEELGSGAPYVAQLVPEIRRLFPDLRLPPCSLEAERDRFYLFDAVAMFLKSAASKQPLILALDDLHAADVASLLLLQFVARALHESPVLLLGTYRDVEARVAPSVGEVLSEITREGQAVRLGGLSEAEVGRLIAATAGFEATEDVVAAVHRATEGNPFFVDGVVRLLLAQEGGPGLKRPSATLRFPEEVRDSIRRRLRALPDDARHLLSIASVIGREFDLTVLEAASGLAREPVLEVVEATRAASVLDQVSTAPGRYHFAHGLIRETLYEDLPPARRVDLHRQIGELLEALYRANPDPHLSELAHHFFAAISSGSADKAIDYGIRAGRRAMETFASEEAIGEYERAHQAMELSAPDDPRRLDLLLELGEALRRSGDVEKAQGIFQRALELARLEGTPVALARAAIGVCGDTWVEVGSFSETRVQIIDEALAALGGKDSLLRAQLLARLVGQLQFSSQHQRRDDAACEALDIARRGGDPSVHLEALRMSYVSLLGEPSRFTERRATTEESVLLANRTSDRFRLATAKLCRLIDLLELGEVTEFEVELESYAELVRQIRNFMHSWRVTSLHATLATMKGAFDAAERCAGEGLMLWQKSLAVMAANTYGGQMFLVRFLQGRIQELETPVRDHVERFPLIAAWRAGLAALCGEMGREAEARSEFERLAANDFSDLPRDYTWTACVINLCSTCAFLGDGRRAAKLYELLLPAAGRNLLLGPAVGAYGAADHYLGVLAATMSRWDQAERHFELGIEMNVRMGAAPLVALARHDFAKMLLVRGDPADGTRASDLIDLSLETARRLGMKGLEEKASRLKSGVAAENTSRASIAADSVFRKDGDFWTIAWQGKVLRLKDVKGLHQIVRLLDAPGREFHSAELLDEAPADLGDAGAALDREAKAAYRSRLADLREEVSEAERFNDAGRAANAREEIEFISRELAAAVGLGGRDRKAASAAERVRLRVTRTIKEAIGRIHENDPNLGHHLSTSVRTGTFCSYQPGPGQPPAWIVR